MSTDPATQTAGEQDVVVVLSQEGRQVLRDAAIDLPNSPRVLFTTRRQDSRGLWVRITRDDGDNELLIRWEYVLAMELLLARSTAEGFVN